MELAEPFDLVLFGGSGDLAMRKLVPALYNIFSEGSWPAGSRVVAVARSEMTTAEYHAFLVEGSKKNIPENLYKSEVWDEFLQVIEYQSIDLFDSASYQSLSESLAGRQEVTRLFYLSTGPSLFVPICQNLGENHLITGLSRIAVEKPLGKDLASAQEINAQMSKHFSESQIFRIDHYLGKEPVQNLIALRFANGLFEPLWRRGRIKDVQITVSEQLGMEGGRGEFYDQTGAMRDMIQNHLLQMLCIIAMEPPTSLEGDGVRDEKLKVLQALRPLVGEAVVENTVRGQYSAGVVNGKQVLGYTDEEGVDPNSHTETYVAIKAHIDSWRWSGVPFFLRTGKNMQEKLSEIVINFEPIPHSIFDESRGVPAPNRLVIRLQPTEGITLSILAKRPGNGMRLTPVNLGLDMSETYSKGSGNAYQRLLVDLMRGELSLFMRHDELSAAWTWVDPIINAWKDREIIPRHYTAGTWGPAASSALVARDGYHWHEESL